MQPYSPKDFMKARRPGRFSDSKIINTSKLNRTILEQHLGSLGVRKQEKDFEEFARKLCQHEICPNLIPQTGSTGGGDSKVDSENTPVASQLQIFFAEGEDSQTKERLGFAFSTQKTWKRKVQDDVKKISETGRNYGKVFFITSEYVRDSTRASVEDELSKLYSFRVIIRDRNWILDKIFGNKRELLAIEELKLGEGLEENKEVGPLDYQRRKKFDDLTVSITDDIDKNQVHLKTVDACLDTALLAAELEEPKQKIVELFDRAIRVSNEYGTEEQSFNALYQKTWTTFFWLEDFEAFIKLYDSVEKLALESDNIFRAERLNNIWGILYSLATTSDLVQLDFLKQKTENLKEKLISIKDKEENPSASVHAESMLSFMSLMENRDNPSEVSKIFKDIEKILDKANMLIGFPFETTFQLLNELDIVFSGQDTYENLQEHLVEIVTKREGDISAGELLLNRGMQHLKADRSYKAINYLGKALWRFHKKESRDSLVKALFFISIAYEDVGLLWAARGALLNAASHATSDFWTYGEVNTMQLACYKRLKTIEVLLGRIGYALAWHETNIAMASQIITTKEKADKLLQESLYFGSIVGMMIIKTPDEQLKMLEKLPNTLGNMDLDFAAFGLMYRLGGKDLLPKSFLDGIQTEGIEKFFDSWLTQPAQESLPEKPEYYTEDTIQLKSKVLGGNFIVRTPNSSPEIEIGEYILGSFESVLSTTMSMNAISRDSETLITISRDEKMGTEIKFEVKKEGKLNISVTSGNFNPHSLSREQQEKINNSISEIVLTLIGSAIMFKDPDVDLKKLFRDEEASSRGFNFSSPMVTLGNVLGYKPKRSISDWIDSKEESYPYSPEKSGKIKKVETQQEGEPGKTEEYAEKIMRHNELRNISVIRQHLWDKAGWKGAFYMTQEFRPPIMAFMFKDEEMAKAIFKDWRETFGSEDKDEVIRISMVRGISEVNPLWYRSLVTTNLDKKMKVGRLVTVTRVHTLTPSSTENLDRFSESFNKFGVYLLAPAIIDETQPHPRVLYEFGIVKKSFNDRQAWEIGPNDIDISAITEDENPIIPIEIKDAPVLELLKKRKNRI